MDADARTYLHIYFLTDSTTFNIYIILNFVFGHYHYKIRNRMMETEDTGGSEV